MDQERKIGFVDVSFNNNFIPNYYPLSINQIVEIAEEYNEANFLAISPWNCNDIPRYFNYLREHPWERLQRLKDLFPHIPLIITANTNSLSNKEPTYPELVKDFFKTLKKYEISTIRLFDPFNNIESLQDKITVCLNMGLEIEGTVFLNPKDPQNIEKTFNVVSFLNDLSSTKTIAIMEPTGILKTHQLKKILKNIEDILEKPLNIAIYGHLERIYALFDVIFQFGTNISTIDVTCTSNNKQFSVNPPNAKLLYGILQEYNIGTDPTLEKILKIEQKFQELLINTNNKTTNIEFDLPALIYRKYPDNLIFEIFSSLKENNTLYIFPKVLDELDKLMLEFEYPPLIAPFSQILASQALFNVITTDKGENRYEILTAECKQYFQGYYTKLRNILSDEILVSSKDHIPSEKIELSQYQLPLTEMRDILTTNELVLYQLYPKEAIEYFEFKSVNEKYAINIFNPQVIARIATDILKVYEGSDIIVSSPTLVNQNSKTNNLWSLVGRLEQMGRHI